MLIDMKRVKIVMIQKEIKMPALAEAVGVSVRTLSEKLNHRPGSFTYDEMINFAEALGVAPDYIFSRLKR